MIKAIFFDFDGVLTSDKTGGYTTCKHLSNVTGIPLPNVVSCYKLHKKQLNTGKTSHKEIWKEFCSCLGEPIAFRHLRAAFDATPKDEAVYRLAVRLRKKYLVGIITDNKKDRFDYLVKKFSLSRKFDALILSADIGAGKESKRIFLHAARQMHVQPIECVFIDNTPKNLTIPRRLGMKTIFFDDKKRDMRALLRDLHQAGVGL